MSASTAPAPAVLPTDRGSSTIDAAALFRMGFDADAVGRALISTQGDPVKALEALIAHTHASTFSSSDVDTPSASELASAEDDPGLALALALSLEQSRLTATNPNQLPETHPTRQTHPVPEGRPTPETRPTRASVTATTAVNPLWAPSRYVPASNSSEALLLNLVETVEVRDGGYGWQHGRAFLDTGNQLMTIVDTRFAARHSIYRAESGFGQAERWTTIRGVVPGVSSRAPCVTIALKIRDQDFLIQAAVSDLGSHDLLLGVDVLDRLFTAGFRIGQGSMG